MAKSFDVSAALQLFGTSAVGCLAACLVATPALAQSAGGSSNDEDAQAVGISTIVVTATRREVGAQDIGIAVTAFTGETLRTRNVVSTEDLSNVTPGLSLIQPGAVPIAGLLAIRGVAQNDFAAHLESSNVLYIDDVYRPSNAGSLQALYDVERVEVLKGPQGTLFGRNATGGLIHIKTAEPGFEFGGYAQVTAGEFGRLAAEGAINLPLSETLALRIAGLASQADGFIQNAIGPDQSPTETASVRAKLLFEPTSDFSMKLQGEWLKNFDNPAGGAFPTGGVAGVDGLGRFRPEPAFTDTGYVDADGDPFTGEFNFPGNFGREQFTVIGQIDYAFSDTVKLTAISAYSDIESTYSEDNDLTPFDITIFRQDTKQTSFSQELRLNADFDNVRLTTGGFYLHIDGDYFQNFQVNNVGNFNGILAPIPVPLFPVGQNQFANYSLETESWSVFGQGEIDLSDQFTLTAGLRYTRDNKNFAYLNECKSLLAAPACPPFATSTLAGGGLISDNSSEGGISARLQLDYKPTDHLLFYASYNRGYKAFNYNAGFAGAAQIADVKFDGEELNAFEIGMKFDTPDRIARINASVFHYDYNDYQAFDQRGVSFILSNTDAKITGAEVELTLQPGGGFDAFLAATVLGTTVEDINIAGVFMDREAPQAADFTFNFALGKTFAFNAGDLRFGVDGNYMSKYFSQLTNAEVTEVGDNWLVNARISFMDPSKRWEAAVFVRNVLNDDRLLYAFDITVPGVGLVEQVFGEPRWLGGSIRFNF